MFDDYPEDAPPWYPGPPPQGIDEFGQDVPPPPPKELSELVDGQGHEIPAMPYDIYLGFKNNLTQVDETQIPKEDQDHFEILVSLSRLIDGLADTAEEFYQMKTAAAAAPGEADHTDGSIIFKLAHDNDVMRAYVLEVLESLHSRSTQGKSYKQVHRELVKISKALDLTT